MHGSHGNNHQGGHHQGGHHQRGHHQHGHHPHEHSARDLSNTLSYTFACAILLNVLFVCGEVAAGIFAHSMALLADAGHNTSDVLGLALAWIAHQLASRPASHRHTYGFGRVTIYAATLNAVALLGAMGALAWESISRLQTPAPVDSSVVSWVAGLGIIVNGASALLIAKNSLGDLNIRSAYLHMISDALISLGVVVCGFAIAWTGWQWLDPVAGIAIAATIAWSSRSLLVESLSLSLDGVPTSIDREEITDYLGNLPGVVAVHDLHIWALGTSRTALTAHLVRENLEDYDRFLANVGAELRERFLIDHATIQIEIHPGIADCAGCEGTQKRPPANDVT